MIHVRCHRDDSPSKEITELHLSLTGASLLRFKYLIDRALNTNVNVHPEWKELGDMLTHGSVTQDYYAQRTDPLPRIDT